MKFINHGNRIYRVYAAEGTVELPPGVTELTELELERVKRDPRWSDMTARGVWETTGEKVASLGPASTDAPSPALKKTRENIVPKGEAEEAFDDWPEPGKEVETEPAKPKTKKRGRPRKKKAAE